MFLTLRCFLADILSYRIFSSDFEFSSRRSLFVNILTTTAMKTSFSYTIEQQYKTRDREKKTVIESTEN